MHKNGRLDFPTRRAPFKLIRGKLWVSLIYKLKCAEIIVLASASRILSFR